ncbi:MAG: tryptophanase [Deltaproteobacteria bacterium]|nr:tryptophanase [Deltaproteobacteria bacterium]
MRTMIEPFRIWTVRSIRNTTPEERLGALEAAGYNLLKIPARDVTVDLVTDSGTGAMSSQQWAAMMTADEAYAGSESLFRLEDAARDLFGYRHVVPTHQGRAAKRLLCAALVEPGTTIPANTHLETSRAAIRALGGETIELPIPEAVLGSPYHPFKGNLDVDRLRQLIEREGAKSIPAVFLAVSSPAGGGQPVSLENIKAVRDLTARHGIRLFLDCAYFAENAYFIHVREEAWRGRPLRDIAGEMFRLADGVMLSARKDGIVNTGGLLAFDSDDLAARVRRAMVRSDGMATHGGLAARDLEGMAIGLQEALQGSYMAHRFETVEHLARSLAREGVPVIQPVGGHAVQLDARAFLPHLEPEDLPAQAVACSLYLLGGIRAAEVGSLKLGGRTDAQGRPLPVPHDLVRFSYPRRTYTRSHIDYVIEATLELFANRHRVAGLEIVDPGERRHLTAVMRPKGGRLLREEHTRELPPEHRALGTCSHPLFQKRRSTRAIAEMHIDEAVIERIVQSFRWAPSCANRQPARLVLARRSPEREALDRTLMEGNEWARTAPILAAVVMSPARAATVNGINYAPFDAGLATQNLVLAAVAEGLVAHPMAGYDEPAARQALAVPEPWRIVAVVAIGFAGDPARLDPATREKDERPRQRLPLSQMVFFERWTDGE